MKKSSPRWSLLLPDPEWSVWKYTGGGEWKSAREDVRSACCRLKYRLIISRKMNSRGNEESSLLSQLHDLFIWYFGIVCSTTVGVGLWNMKLHCSYAIRTGCINYANARFQTDFKGREKFTSSYANPWLIIVKQAQSVFECVFSLWMLRRCMRWIKP